MIPIDLVIIAHLPFIQNWLQDRVDRASPHLAFASVSLLFVYQDGTTVRDQKVLMNKQPLGKK
jgi:hypothetical protein